MQQQILSITQINDYLRGKTENDPFLNQVAIRGEISNYKLYPSGHHYFTLKDENASIKCVIFKGNAFRLRFRPENGMKVIAIGKVTVYPRDGIFQMYCASLTMDGIGDLYAAFEQLKGKLASKGLFNPEHKKKLPLFPGTIGIITSPAGAAIHDMLRILNKRYPLTQVKLLPVRVQGVEAPGEIAAAIQYANQHRLADLLIVGRGGGSIEDLWAFNDERVAYAIYNSQIPVISAVGHEPDVTIADYVADVRAATPSNAAEIAVPDQNTLIQNMDSASTAMVSALSSRLRFAKERFYAISSSPVLSSPMNYLEQRRLTLEHLQTRLVALQTQNVHHCRQRFISSAARLDAMSPLKVLTRGYAISSLEDGTVLRSVKQLSPGQIVNIKLADGNVIANVTEIKEDIQ